MRTKLTAWRSQAGKGIGQRGVNRLEVDTLGSATFPPSTDPSDLPLDALARTLVSTVSAEKATWTRWNLIAEVERRLRPLHFDSADARQAATDYVLEHALHPDVAVRLTTDGLEPDVDQDMPELATARRSDGESVLHEHGSTRYTTQDLLDAEQRLLTYTGQCTSHSLGLARVLELMTAFEQRHAVTLDPGQRALVTGFTTDPRRLVIGIGPAGAGKTTALKAVAEAWRTTGRRVIPLAPSATAAEVLGTELRCRAENLHKFRHAHETAPTGQPDDRWFVLDPGDLVLVDEAGMAGTRNLDWLTHYAREHGAIIRFLGDPAQLTSVEAGGALGLLAHSVGAVELTDLHRFINPDEATATLGIREGQPAALEFYASHDRIRFGSTHAMLESAYDAWERDMQAGRASLLIANSGSDVTALNAQARATRVEAGLVTQPGVPPRDGTRAGVGDLIVTRRKRGVPMVPPLPTHHPATTPLHLRTGRVVATRVRCFLRCLRLSRLLLGPSRCHTRMSRASRPARSLLRRSVRQDVSMPPQQPSDPSTPTSCRTQFEVLNPRTT